MARWIEIVSWLFAAFGLLLPFLFFTPLFAPYRDALSRYAYGSPSIPPSDERLLGLMLGIAGGSIAGKWIVHALIARGPLAEGRAWARSVTLLGLAAWFVVDSIASIVLGATFNVWMINLVPLVLAGVPLLLAYRAFDRDDDVAADVPWGLAKICFWTAVFGATTGLVIAFGGNTPSFDTWFAGLEDAHYAGSTIAQETRRLALAFFGPIGGSTFAQFVMLASFLQCDGPSRRAARAGAISIASWCAIDSGYGLANDGMFNIMLVNMPALVVTWPPWVLLARSAEDA